MGDDVADFGEQFIREINEASERVAGGDQKPPNAGAFAPVLGAELRESLNSTRSLGAAITDSMVGPQVRRRLEYLGVTMVRDLVSLTEPWFLRTAGLSHESLDLLRASLWKHGAATPPELTRRPTMAAPTPGERPVPPNPPRGAPVAAVGVRKSALDRSESAIEGALVGLIRQHGEHCHCRVRRTVGAAVIDSLVLDEIRRQLPPRSLITLEVLSAFGHLMPGAEIAKAAAFIATITTAPCRTAAAEPEVGDAAWRQVVRVGVHAREDAWPDEWGVEHWAAWMDVDPIEDDRRGVGTIEANVADGAEIGRPWTWNSVVRDEGEPPHNPARWGADAALRALHIVRTSIGYSWEVRIRDIAELGMVARQPFQAARGFVRYVDECDRGLAAADPTTKVAIDMFARSNLHGLGARVRMIDELAAGTTADTPHDPDVEDELRELSYLDTSVPAGDDGQPDPLALLRNLLPGGKWVLGKAPIVHSPTELEAELLPELFQRPPTLVILSGNAGDGKTAFIESVLEAAGQLVKPVPNELRVELDGRPYRVVLDGSEDSYDRSNAQLLHDALGAFKGDREVQPAEGTLIAVNKGRLLSFLEDEKADYPALWRLALRRYAEGDEVADSGYLLVDLNDRTVVGPDLTGSLFGSVLGKLLSLDAWNECGTCDAVAQCPVMFNVHAMRDQGVQQRAWELFALIDLDDRLHVTARHVVTRLASVISAGMRCPDIRRTVAHGGRFEHRSYFYGGAFMGRADESSVEEAILNDIAAAYDPAETSDPQRDRVLGSAIASGSVRDVAPWRDDLPTSDVAELETAAASLANRTVDEPTYGSSLEYREAHLALMTQLLRRRYFLAEDAVGIVPVRAFADYRRLAGQPGHDGLSLRIVRSLNATLGITRVVPDGLIVPRDYARGLSGSGFALKVPIGMFVSSRGTGLGTPYRESRFTRSWPRSVRLEARDGEAIVASLTIPLLMLEILDRASRGFRPTSRTERNYMIRVATFYRRLAEHRWASTLDYVMYERGRVRAAVAIDDGDLDFWVP